MEKTTEPERETIHTVNYPGFFAKLRLADILAQSEAAALAVLIANIHENHVANSAQEKAKGASGNYNELADHTMCAFLDALEQCALRSIQANDGRLTYWIGFAAKQLNPLLS